MESKSVWSNIKTEFDILNKYPELVQVTASNPTPIPGYLFGEVNAFTFVNDGANCKPLVNHFMIQLRSSSPTVKMKVLKMLLHLVRNGHPKIIHEVKLNEVQLKETTSFGGIPDQFHGTAFYETVRNLAKELLEYVFSEDLQTGISLESRQGSSKLAGYGSQATVDKLQGFGSTAKQSMTVGEQITTSITSFVDQVFPSADKETSYYANKATLLKESLPKYEPLIVERSKSQGSDREESSKSVSSKTFVTPKSVHVVGKAGGGWDDSDGEDQEGSDNLTISCNDSTEPSVSADSLENKPEGALNSEWIEENSIVEEFVVDQPLEKLTWEDITALCKKSSVLNCDRILVFLVEKLSQSEKENLQLRCLVLIEYFIQLDIANLESLTKFVMPVLEKMPSTGAPAVLLKSKKICLIVDRLNGRLPPKVETLKTHSA